MEIALNDEVLLRTDFVSADVSSANSYHVAARSQMNLHDPWPWLLTTRMNVPSATTTHGFTVWVSDSSSNFKRFPGQ